MSCAAPPPVASTGPLDRFARYGFWTSVLGLVFVAGAAGAYWNCQPARTVVDGLRAASAWSSHMQLSTADYPQYLWFPARSGLRGVAPQAVARATDDLTLYTAADDGHALLVDESGQVVHRWRAPFRSVWPNPTHVSRWTPDRAVFIRCAHAFPDGDLLALYESPAQTPNGCGLARLDREGRPRWTLDVNAHHDFDIGPDGTIFVLTHRVRDVPLEAWPELSLPLVDEFVAVVTPEGRLQRSLSLLEMLARSPYHVPVLNQRNDLGDVLHSNTVHVVGAEFAAHYPELEPDDLLVCLRNLDLVAAVRPSSEQIVWATTGPWRMPHDPDPLPNGNLLIFDNCFAQGARQGSRVLEFDPRTSRVVWSYGERPDQTLRSDIRSCQQLLEGGNVLITESDGGRLLEVTRTGDIAWEYVHPLRGGANATLVPAVGGARRYPRTALPFVVAPPAPEASAAVAASSSSRP